MTTLPVAERMVIESYACPNCECMEWGTPDPFDAIEVKECHQCGQRFLLPPEEAEIHGCPKETPAHNPRRMDYAYIPTFYDGAPRG